MGDPFFTTAHSGESRKPVGTSGTVGSTLEYWIPFFNGMSGVFCIFEDQV